jgi:hypothetical protein
MLSVVKGKKFAYRKNVMIPDIKMIDPNKISGLKTG